MARYIDAEVGIAVINASDLGVGMKSLLRSLFDNIKTADVVEVVRCGDCKHRFLNHKCLNQNSGYYERERNSNDFCSYAERNDKK